MQHLADKLERAFNPRTIAVVGDKKAGDYIWLRNNLTFQGKLYSVQIDPNELPGIAELGVPNFMRLADIPDPIDYVVIAVPREVAPRIIADCIKVGVGAAHLFTAGFGESGDETGAKLERMVVDMATQAGLCLIGPNCMGVYNPKIGLRHWPDQYHGEAGSVGIISQSGTHAILFSQLGHANGVRVSKSVSYGNGIITDCPDFLEYLGQDEETRVIGIYLEGVRDGRRFFDVLRKTTPQKPVLIWKGAQSEAGLRASSSHSAQLTTTADIWEAAIKQAGATMVNSVDEMVDTAKALLFAPPPAGNRVGLMTMTGGPCVVIGDAFSAEGFEVPPLIQESYQRLGSFFNVVGGISVNPLDVGGTFAMSGEHLDDIFDIMDKDPGVDSLVMDLGVGLMGAMMEQNPKLMNKVMEAAVGFRKQSTKPLLFSLTPAHREAQAAMIRDQLTQIGIPCYPTFQRAAKALKNAVEYYRFHGS